MRKTSRFYLLILLTLALLLPLSVELGAKTFEFFIVPTPNATIKASSTLVEKGRPDSTYAAEKAMDGNEKTAWCEGNKGDGEYSVWEFHLPKPVTANGIVVYHGVGYNNAIYEANNRPRDFQVEFYTVGGMTFRVEGTFGSPRKLGPEETVSSSCHAPYAVERWTEECKSSTSGDKGFNACLATKKKGCASWNDLFAQEGYEIEAPSSLCLTGAKIMIKSVDQGGKYRDTCISEAAPYRKYMLNSFQERMDKGILPTRTQQRNWSISSKLVTECK